MKMLNRLFLLTLAIVLIASAFASYSSATEIPIFHDTYYHSKYPWLMEVRHVTFFGVLIWCFLFVKSEPACVRIGLLAVILAFTIILLPPKILRHPIEVPSWH